GFLPLLSSEDSGNPEADFAPALAASAPDSHSSGQHPIVRNESLNGQSGGSQPGGAQAGAPRDGTHNPDLDLLPAGSAGSPAGGSRPIKIPDRIVIPAIGVDAPIEAVGLREIEYKRQNFQQWTAPDSYAAGWHNTSATLGLAGNTVLNGHHNAYGEIFRDLSELQEGDLIYVYSGDEVFTYKVGLNKRLNERFRPVEERLENARWILPSPDERLTIITCWPYESNTHRIVIVAIPDRDDTGTIQ
ncbi:MAG: sortase, partial [Anaerolineales bacterium]|nr:sortase [Anaerolineales bacterium]